MSVNKNLQTKLLQYPHILSCPYRNISLNFMGKLTFGELPAADGYQQNNTSLTDTGQDESIIARITGF